VTGDDFTESEQNKLKPPIIMKTKKFRLVGVGAAALMLVFGLVAKNLDSTYIDICRADYASHPANGASCCANTCQAENPNGSEQDIKDCAADCMKQITPPPA
jgi:hypothetical protein